MYPLSAAGLWEAVICTPAAARRRRTANATSGVGRGRGSRTTENPAAAIGRPDLGTLKVGSIGEATVIDLKGGTFDYTDSLGERMIGDKRLLSAGVVLAGRWWHPA